MGFLRWSDGGQKVGSNVLKIGYCSNIGLVYQLPTLNTPLVLTIADVNGGSPIPFASNLSSLLPLITQHSRHLPAPFLNHGVRIEPRLLRLVRQGCLRPPMLHGLRPRVEVLQLDVQILERPKQDHPDNVGHRSYANQGVRVDSARSMRLSDHVQHLNWQLVLLLILVHAWMPHQRLNDVPRA